MGGKKHKDKANKAESKPEGAPVTIEVSTAGDDQIRPKTGDACTVHYIGKLASDGTVFDSSRDKKVPFHFKLGGGGVIRGWDLGVAQMCLNQRATLCIAAHAAYGSAGCKDTANASGTGVIPPNADLVFDVELLDINFHVTLRRYRATLDSWVGTKLAAFDADEGAPERERHGSRPAYETYLQGVVAKKYQAERTKRFASAGIDASTIPDTAAATTEAGEAIGTLSLDATRAADAAASAAAEKAGEAQAKPPTGADKAAKDALHFDTRFATFKVEPNDEGEAASPNFPRSLHNAAELFAHLGHTESAAALHRCVTNALTTLAAGPDGKSSQKLGRACVCWSCGHVGLPRNSAHCADAGPTPAGVCASCGDDSQTNFVKHTTKEGKTLPWIEGAPPLTAQQASKSQEAERAAKAAEAQGASVSLS